MKKMRPYVLIAAAALALAACGKKEEPAKPASAPPPPVAAAPAPAPAGVSVAALALGKAIGPDKKVMAATDAFAKTDRFYVSVDTTGMGNATLKAKWTYVKDGQSANVNESEQVISANGPATSEFHISKSDGWPVGDYQVEVFVDGKPAGTKKFSVK